MKNISHTEIVFPVGTRVRIKPGYQDDHPLRALVLTVRSHQMSGYDPNDQFVDNCLYTDAGECVGGFANWELVPAMDEGGVA